MLATDQVTLPTQESQRGYVTQNWHHLREQVLHMVDHRLTTSSPQHEWYQSSLLFQKELLESSGDLSAPYEVNSLSKGYLGEVLFYNACSQSGIKCAYTDGLEDVMGADFKICLDDEVRFLDVTVNTSARGIERKSNVASFPTIFLPWGVSTKSIFTERDPLHDVSYAERYIRTGKFDGNEYIHRVLDINYEMLYLLQKYVWRGVKPNWKLYGRSELTFKKADVIYVKNLEGILLLMRKCMDRKACT